ncbi:MAG TPA: hypothetical protein VFV66_36100 [Nonomuraea sp.]|nr:hypothetical protein [Nonomuraea sp.]
MRIMKGLLVAGSIAALGFLGAGTAAANTPDMTYNSVNPDMTYNSVNPDMMYNSVDPDMMYNSVDPNMLYN